MAGPNTDIRTALVARRDPSQPFITHLSVDGRVELSGASVRNGAAKIANALIDEFDLRPGDAVGVHLPWHWQRITWLLGIWSAGCTVVPGGGEECDLLVAGPTEAIGLPGTVHVISTHPWGMPLDAAAAAQLPPGIEDVTDLVRSQPDEQLNVADHSIQIALDELTQVEVLQMGRDIAAAYPGALRLGIGHGEYQWWLPAVWPLVTDGSAVITDGSDPGALAVELLDASV
ncbi:MAG: TIGR03089 family protein [Candidatus Nanopelagicales bacterium]